MIPVHRFQCTQAKRTNILAEATVVKNINEESQEQKTILKLSHPAFHIESDVRQCNGRLTVSTNVQTTHLCNNVLSVQETRCYLCDVLAQIIQMLYSLWHCYFMLTLVTLNKNYITFVFISHSSCLQTTGRRVHHHVECLNCFIQSELLNGNRFP